MDMAQEMMSLDPHLLPMLTEFTDGDHTFSHRAQVLTIGKKYGQYIEVLYHYGTPVIACYKANGSAIIKILWHNYSNTTNKVIRAYLNMLGWLHIWDKAKETVKSTRELMYAESIIEDIGIIYENKITPFKE